VISGHKVPTIVFTDGWDWYFMLWLAIANSFTMDFIARKKVSLSMSYTVLDSLPFPRLSSDDSLARRLVPLALKLTCCGPEMRSYWNARAAEGWVATAGENVQLGEEDEDERIRLRAEIDAVIAHDIFGLTAEELDYLLETFPIVKRKDIEKHGDYRTKL